MMIPSYTATVIWYGDLENRINQIYGKDPNILAHEEASQNSFREVDTTYEPDLYVMDNIRAWLQDEYPSISAEQAIRLLVGRKELPSGVYIITLWW